MECTKVDDLLMEKELQERVEMVLEKEVQPTLAMHGGGVELVEVTKDNVVKVKLTGACSGCPMSQMTILGVVERTLISRIPEVQKVEPI